MDRKKHNLTDYIIIVALSILIAVWLFSYNRFLGGLSIILVILASFNQYNIIDKRNRKIKLAYMDVVRDMENLAAIAVYDMPLPVLVLNSKNNIIWYNHHLPDILEDDGIEPLNMNIDDLFK